MCGLFGWIHTHDLSSMEHDAMRIVAATFALANDGRGGDSWGIYDGHAVERGLGRIAGAFCAEDLARRPLLLAHTRFATRGKVLPQNAHPFEHGNIIGAHNGIITNHTVLNYRYDRHFDVDSQHIFAHLDERKDLSDLTGYGAITYINRNLPSVVSLGRFNSGVLSVARFDCAFVWSSEDGPIRWAARLANLPIRCLYTLKPGRSYDLSVAHGLRKRGHLRIRPDLTGTGSTWRYQDWEGMMDDGEIDPRFTASSERQPPPRLIASSTPVVPTARMAALAAPDPRPTGAFAHRGCEGILCGPKD